MSSFESGLVFQCSNGGHVQMIDDTYDLDEFGVEDGRAFWNDLFVNAYSDMSLDVSDNYDTTATIKHLTGDSIMRFNLTSLSPNGTADIKLEGLKPEAFYRLEFNGILAKTASGRAHGESTPAGVIEFKEVEVPN